MTISTAVAGTATIGMAAVVAIDPTVVSIVGVVVGAVVTIITVVFAYKTAALGKKVDAQDVKIAEVIKTSDGMKDALVKATGSEAMARGVLAGIEQSEAKAAVKFATLAEGRAQVGQAGPQSQPLLQVPVLLPSQVQPVAAEGVEGVKLTAEQIEKMILELNEQLRLIKRA